MTFKSWKMRLNAILNAACLLCGVLFFVYCSKAPVNLSPLSSAPAMDLERIAGDWSVAARIPTYFDPDVALMNVKIEKDVEGKFRGQWIFSAEKDGSMKEYNFSIAPGLGKDSTKWSVKAFWLLKFDLRVLEFSGDYSWIAVGSEDRRYFWLLTTGKSSDGALVEAILKRQYENGFSKEHILFTNKL